ncbi:MAG: hypothetical protein HN509_09895 [Halobacteriovoraceae bacterium]|nr:hypothetical protein [Halobacteriovoraceae bacterium]MBT5092964.1 hypothetical protein [Halobacteriovoraceae bacterium]
MSKNILIVDTNAEVLFQFPVNEIERAYVKALELEDMGIEFELNIPSLPETLANSLGASDQERLQIRAEIEEEIAGHNSPTCSSDDPQ